MKAHSAFAALILTLSLALSLGGCAGFGQGKSEETAKASAAMALTADNVAMVRVAVAGAKAKAPRAETRDDYVRLARAVYVAPWAAGHNAAATTEVALAQAKAGNQAARDYLTIMVYDIQLQTAMEGTSLSTEDWRAVYVGSGIMTEAAYAAYVDMARGGKVLPQGRALEQNASRVSRKFIICACRQRKAKALFEDTTRAATGRLPHGHRAFLPAARRARRRL